MMKLFLASFLLSAQAFAGKITCELSEKFSGRETHREVVFETESKSKKQWDVDFAFGAGKVSLRNEFIHIEIPDPNLKKNISASLGIVPGRFARLQIIPDAATSDYIMMDCFSEGSAPAKTVDGAQCELVETVGGYSIKTPFNVPLAANGHDVYFLQQAKLSPLSGWVILFNDILMTHLQNKDTYTSVTGMGDWGQLTVLNWFPSPQDLAVEVRCVPSVK